MYSVLYGTMEYVVSRGLMRGQRALALFSSCVESGGVLENPKCARASSDAGEGAVAFWAESGFQRGLLDYL